MFLDLWIDTPKSHTVSEIILGCRGGGGGGGPLGHGPPPQESKFYIRYRTESEKSPRTTLDWPKNKGWPPPPSRDF